MEKNSNNNILNFLKKFLPNKKEVLDLISSLLTAVVICIFLFVFIVVPSEVEGESMKPNFATGDRLYTVRLFYWLGGTPLGDALGLKYNRGDIVVVDKPNEKNSIIKRIIGLPGDKLLISGGKIFINGKELVEPYLAKGVETHANGSFAKEGEEINIMCPWILGGSDEDCFFVMGDNRGGSRDSRDIGLIKRSWMQGKVVLRIWPLDKFSTFQTPEVLFR
jgi:signal peptidase I